MGVWRAEKHEHTDLVEDLRLATLLPVEYYGIFLYAFRQAYEQIMERYVYRKCEPPNYKERERTPYEAYRDDRNDGITVKKEKGHVG